MLLDLKTLSDNIRGKNIDFSVIQNKSLMHTDMSLTLLWCCANCNQLTLPFCYWTVLAHQNATFI